jgi:hypothetical protein
MVNPVQGAGSGAMMPQVEQTRMTEGQKSSFQEIISKYDPENFSQNDFKAMEGELRQAGIGRTREAKSMLEDAGFNIDQFAKGGPGGTQGPGGPPPMQGGINIQALQSFQEILHNYDVANMSSEDQENLMNDLTSSGLLQSGLILNIKT